MQLKQTEWFAAYLAGQEGREIPSQGLREQWVSLKTPGGRSQLLRWHREEEKQMLERLFQFITDLSAKRGTGELQRGSMWPLASVVLLLQRVQHAVLLFTRKRSCPCATGRSSSPSALSKASPTCCRSAPRRGQQPGSPHLWDKVEKTRRVTAQAEVKSQILNGATWVLYLKTSKCSSQPYKSRDVKKRQLLECLSPNLLAGFLAAGHANTDQCASVTPHERQAQKSIKNLLKPSKSRAIKHHNI